jgi:hypothetical protein
MTFDTFGQLPESADDEFIPIKQEKVIGPKELVRYLEGALARYGISYQEASIASDAFHKKIAMEINEEIEKETGTYGRVKPKHVADFTFKIAKAKEETTQRRAT